MPTYRPLVRNPPGDPSWLIRLYREYSYAFRIPPHVKFYSLLFPKKHQNHAHSSARRANELGGFVYSAEGLIAALMGQLAGVMNALGWSIVALYLLFTLAYAYFLFMKRDESTS